MCCKSSHIFFMCACVQPVGCNSSRKTDIIREIDDATLFYPYFTHPVGCYGKSEQSYRSTAYCNNIKNSVDKS